MAASIKARGLTVLVDAVATSNIMLSGSQMIDGVTLTTDKLCFASAQTDPNEIAIYLVQSEAPWVLVTPGFSQGLRIYVKGGTAGAGTEYLITNDIEWGAGAPDVVLVPAPGGDIEAPQVTADSVRLSTSGPPTPTAGFIDLASGNGDNLILQDQTGDQIAWSLISNSGTSLVAHRLGAVTMADDATVDITVGAQGGHGRVTATDGTTSVSGVFSFAGNVATSQNGLTQTNFNTMSNDGDLCVYANGALLRVENKLGGSRRVLIEIMEPVAV